MYCFLYTFSMRIILVRLFIIIGIIIGILISVSGSYASVLYTTPAMFPPPDKIIAPWSQNAKGPERKYSGKL